MDFNFRVGDYKFWVLVAGVVVWVTIVLWRYFKWRKKNK